MSVIMREVHTVSEELLKWGTHFLLSTAWGFIRLLQEPRRYSSYNSTQPAQYLLKESTQTKSLLLTSMNISTAGRVLQIGEASQMTPDLVY